jgi:site-specific DNA-cytosine methylase
MLLMHMCQMKATAMNAHWVAGSDLSPLEARFGIRANFKDFHPPGAVMYVYINEQLRRKGTDHGAVLYWCGRPASGGGGLGFCPKRCTIYNRRHFNVDPRFVYGMCVGGQFEAMLKVHSKARKWSERDARALTDQQYRNNLLERMMRQGLASMSPAEFEQRKELVKQAVELMGHEDQRQLVSELVSKDKLAENQPMSDAESVSSDEEQEPEPRRSSREQRSKSDRMKWWNPDTKQYEGGGAKLDAHSVMGARSKAKKQKLPRSSAKNRSGSPPWASIEIFDAYTGTGGIVPVVAEVSRNTGIRLEVMGLCEIEEVLRQKLMQRYPSIQVFDDIMDIKEGELPEFQVFTCSPPCQDFSTVGNAHGPGGKHSKSFPMITEIMEWRLPIVVCIEEVIGFLTWNGVGTHLQDKQEGAAFVRFRQKCEEIGYYVYHIDIQLAKLNVPQFRDRLWIIPVRKDVADAIGGPPLTRPELEEPPTIGAFLRGGTSYYSVVMPITHMNVDTTQIHYKFKPHLIGTMQLEDPDSGIRTHQVWGETGLSPCVRTSNRIFVALGNDVVEIELEGLAALQGIPLTELPSDRDAARIAIGNGINRRMHEYVMTMTLLYTNQYLLVAEGKRDESTPTTTAVDEIEEEPAIAVDEIEEDPATTQRVAKANGKSRKQYEELLSRLSGMKHAEAQAASAGAGVTESAAPTRGWRCYHENDPRSHSQAKANVRQASARANAQRKSTDKRDAVNQIGKHWQAEFRRIARENGVTEAKLAELDETHCKEGSQEQLLHALKALMIGEGESCTTVAQELASQAGLSNEIFEEMAVYASNNSLDFESMGAATAEDIASKAHSETWKTDPHWEPANNIDEQLRRPDGEGAETFKYAKGEVDHMRDTGGVITMDRRSSEVQSDLKNSAPLDCKWVIVRKMKKCPTTARLVYARLRLRLTLRGFRQRAGLQFDPHGTFAPVMHLGSLLLLLTIAVLFKLHIRLADDSKAFCEGVMDYKMYCILPISPSVT